MKGIQMKVDTTRELCLKEMFDRVGLEYPNELTKEPEWFLLAHWTSKEEQSFKDWMIKFLKDNTRYNKETRDLETNMFLLMWGWTTNLKLYKKRRKEERKPE